MTKNDSTFGVFQIAPGVTLGEIAEQIALRADNLDALLSAATEPNVRPTQEYLYACLNYATEIQALSWKLANRTRD